MITLPVIVGFGGINSAGRSSGCHSYKRMIADVLTHEQISPTWQDLAHRMGLAGESTLSQQTVEAIKHGTLLRRIQSFDTEHVPCHHKAILEQDNQTVCLVMKQSKLSQALADQSQQTVLPDSQVRVQLKTSLPILVPDTLKSLVSSAGELPTGFDPCTLYNSHHHPRGLAMTVYGASDALNSLGFEWEDILKYIKPDEISVYAGSGLSQVDDHSFGGLFQQPLRGNRINSKMMPLALAEMPADFINSYIINNVGTTGNNIGACASFLYNLRSACMDIQSGRTKVALVGNSEAPIIYEIIEGFRVMGALATDESLCDLDQTTVPNHRRACRPFSTNSGFTLAESAQFFVIMTDELAVELGATIYGSVADIFINADANKKSIAGPGVGNYVTVAKAAALAKAILGDSGVRQTFVQAHGTGTPQNRVTESHILNEVAKTFGIENWAVSAVKSYIGHSISSASGDQLTASLGVWQYGWIPGIKSIDHVASDVYSTHLNILKDHLQVNPTELKGVVINSKGFGGNNASALVLSPKQTMDMLQVRFGQKALATYWGKNAQVKEHQIQRDQQTCQGNERIIYKFGQSVMDAHSVSLSPESIRLSEFEQEITLPTINPYAGYF